MEKFVTMLTKTYAVFRWYFNSPSKKYIHNHYDTNVTPTPGHTLQKPLTIREKSNVRYTWPQFMPKRIHDKVKSLTISFHAIFTLLRGRR